MTEVRTSDRFAINSPAVVSEIIDGEAVIMNLKSGHYFSIQGSGALIWDWIGQGHSLGSLIESTNKAFSAEPDHIATHVHRFIDALLEHELVRPIERVDEAAASPPAPAEVTGSPAPFEVPLVEVFNDMQDLLLLDPIHDVDDTGWPRLKEEDEQEAHS